MPFDTSTPHPEDRLQDLLGNAYYYLLHSLRSALPPPLTGAQEDLRRRDHAAIARIAALHPANLAEAELAAQFVAASEQAKECLRLAQLPETTPVMAMKCRAQGASMMRQAQSAIRVLLLLQTARRKVEANNAACDRGEWIERLTTDQLTQALDQNQLAADPVRPHTEPADPDPVSAGDPSSIIPLTETPPRPAQDEPTTPAPAITAQPRHHSQIPNNETCDPPPEPLLNRYSGDPVPFRLTPIPPPPAVAPPQAA